MQTTILNNPASLAREFARCCQEYPDLDIAVAWCGNPKKLLPFSLLASFSGTIRATIGISFNHTHPSAIEYFMGMKSADLRIYNHDDLFHPKVYLFTSGTQFALFVGSSNFTYSGFAENIETNTLIEGELNDAHNLGINELRSNLDLWHSEKFSFAPTTKWLTDYRQLFEQEVKNQKIHKIWTPPQQEEELESSNWLRDADWNTYYTAVIEGLRQRKRDIAGYLDVLKAARVELPLPWTVDYFRHLEKRRIIAGKGEHGWLGHIGASGGFMHLLANGTSQQQETIVRCMNRLGGMQAPLSPHDFNALQADLVKLTELGPTLKVWGRFLTLVRPDLYCTIASTSVRKNLANTLDMTQSQFQLPAGYIHLLKLIHRSPWFNSSKPKSAEQLKVWESRVAFMDAIYHDT